MKSRFILILAILCAVFLIIAVGSCSAAHKQRVSRDKEMSTRLDAEEKLSQFTQQKQEQEKKIALLTRELEEEKAAHQASKKALLQEQLVNQSLKEELQKVLKLKEALEEDLKEAKAANTKR